MPYQIEEISKEQDNDFGIVNTTDKWEKPHRSYYVNAKFRHVVSNPHYVKTSMVEHRDEDSHFTHKISKNDKDCNMIVERPDGNYANIRIKSDRSRQDIVIQSYNRNSYYYTFFFTVKVEKSKVYFAIRKTISEIVEMGDNNHLSLISKDSVVTVIKENALDKNAEENLKTYTEEKTFKDLLDDQKGIMGCNIHLTFEKCYDSAANIDFIPFIYQDKRELKSHHLVTFDVSTMKVVRHAHILSELPRRPVLIKSEADFV